MWNCVAKELIHPAAVSVVPVFQIRAHLGTQVVRSAQAANNGFATPVLLCSRVESAASSVCFTAAVCTSLLEILLNPLYGCVA